MPKEDDDQIFEAFREGRSWAFRSIYDRFYKDVQYWVFLKVKDEDIVTNIISDSFLKVWQNRRHPKSLEHVKASLFVIARNACIDHLRKLKTDRKIVLDNSFPDNVEEDVDLHEVQTKLLSLIHEEKENLPPQCRKIFDFIFVQEKKVKDIAKELGISIYTVHAHKKKALEVLRNALKDEINPVK